jgi:hypothetical protein
MQPEQERQVWRAYLFFTPTFFPDHDFDSSIIIEAISSATQDSEAFSIVTMTRRSPTLQTSWRVFLIN